MSSKEATATMHALAKTERCGGCAAAAAAAAKTHLLRAPALSLLFEVLSLELLQLFVDGCPQL